MPNDLNPASLDAERFLLGVLIRDGKPFPSDQVEPVDFYDPQMSDIAHAVFELSKDGVQIDELTVIGRLTEWGCQITPHTVNQLTTDVGFSQYNAEWAKQIKRTATLRQIGDFVRIASEATINPTSDPASILSFINEHTAKLADIAKPKTKGPQKMELQALADFDRQNDPNSVLGNRWLCKGGSLLIVGQSGTGKSSLMMQAAVQWAVGRPFFGIRAKNNRPLRIVILQAENDAGDVAEALQDVCEGAFLYPDEKQRLDENLVIYRDTTSVGKSFPPMLKSVIEQHQADLVMVDPLLSFAGIDISSQEEASHFLRHDLAPILLETGAILVAMHHTGKPGKSSDREGQTVADLAYSGLGSSEFTNYFREVAVLMRCQGSEPIYRFGLTKRRGRAGMKNAHGDFAPEVLLRHAREQGVIRWEYASESDLPQPDASNSNAKGSPRRLDKR